MQSSRQVVPISSFSEPGTDADQIFVDPIELHDRDVHLRGVAEENCITLFFKTDGVISELKMEFTIEAAREYRDWLNKVLDAHDARP
ncbi:MAG: hypothetical protein JSS14_22290 [Proteobacteria bacterium]|nr:hypothetical protein [Pseudomonadota bacterium]